MLLQVVLLLSSVLSGVLLKHNGTCEPTSNRIINLDVLKTGVIYYSDFDSLSDLRFDCDLLFYPISLPLRISINFKLGFVLNETIDLNPFTFTNFPCRFTFMGLRGFDIEMPGPLFLFNASDQLIAQSKFAFSNCKFEFYYRGNLIDEQLCDAEILGQVEVQIFDGLKDLGFLMTSFKRPICPLVFKNAFIRTLVLDRLEADFLEPNTISFLAIKNEESPLAIFDSKIFRLFFELAYNLRITSQFFNPSVFYNLNCVYIAGKLSYLEAGLFKYMFYLTRIELYLDNMREFLHSSTNEWMGSILSQGPFYLNKQEMLADVGQNRSKILFFVLADKSTKYDYPDEDFCLFKFFPGRKAILTSIQFSNTDVLYAMRDRAEKCTFKFLLQNTKHLDRVFTYYYSGNTIEDFDQDEIDACDLSHRIWVCLNSSDSAVQQSHRHYPDAYDTVYVLKWLDFIGPVISFPILSALAFLSNLIVILVILNKKNHKEKLFDSKIFEYILANSIFNCFECVLYEFRLLNICISRGSIYCPDIKSTQFASFFGVYTSGYLSETLKTCSMLTGLFFSIQRYIETSKTDRKLLLKFSNIKMKPTMIFILFLSAASSVIRIFEFDSISDSLYDSPAQFHIFVYTASESAIPAIFYFFHYIFNDLFLLLINLVVDVMLVTVIKQNLKLKLKFSGHENHPGAMKAGESQKDLKALENKRSVERKANSMILVNLLIYIFCRLPELVGKFFFFFDTQTACVGNSLCYLISDLVEYLYMFAYTFNLFIYYKFNLNFTKGLRNFFHLKPLALK